MSGAAKRAASPTRAISPPPLKRKVESTVTKRTVASFFTPTSQKKPEKITWRVVNNSLVIGKHTTGPGEQPARREKAKVAAFDLDSTLVVTASGNTFPRDSADWKWFSPNVPTRLRELNANGYHVVIMSNQKRISLQKDLKGGRADSKSLTNFKERVTGVMRQIDIPISVYAATADDENRKPRTGMWREFVEDYDLDVFGVDLSASFYVGDAAGRLRDHSMVDRGFAMNVGIPFKTPEEFFLNQAAQDVQEPFNPSSYLKTDTQDGVPVPFARQSPRELVIFCGSPGAGKSTFYWNHLEPLGYDRVNQDTLKTRQKCIKVAKEFLAAGSSVVVDNTNADPSTRAEWVRVAKEFNVPIRCVHFTSPPDLCKHNNAVRAANRSLNPESRAPLPGIAFGDFLKRFKEPTMDEGFSDIVRVDFQFQGDEEARRIWGQYWI
ncbi:bifunctional polynucleotide phosphatase/kinase [Aspergillus udagawae]|uniref:Bifunctional polynucleotide phosphatase/kinase n=1 Tax=Aspergillus udagawae TaxID=91492 RepID=A0ABQ1B086_9EURO|nr:bifunctional polynucleotide phosphatase/kinase [Aspergillus udagawae]GFF89841.1 bifunctional polynucleotide phosphatase/kinase [Aspergillus udagawae]GFG20122.1 bifunctional polynucleotide phosphatase/kinase [Aspergillus udagawae]